MKFLKLLIWGIILSGIIVFAYANHGFILIDLWPSPYQVNLPVLVFAFVIFVTGYLFGYSLCKVNNCAKRKKHSKDSDKA